MGQLSYGTKLKRADDIGQLGDIQQVGIFGLPAERISMRWPPEPAPRSHIGVPVLLEGVRIGHITKLLPNGDEEIRVEASPEHIDQAFARMHRRWKREGSKYWKRYVAHGRRVRGGPRA